MITFAAIWKTILALIGTFIGVFFYAKNEGKKQERAKSDSLILDDVVTAKKIDGDVNNLSDSEVNIRLRPFFRKAKK